MNPSTSAEQAQGARQALPTGNHGKDTTDGHQQSGEELQPTPLPSTSRCCQTALEKALTILRCSKEEPARARSALVLLCTQTLSPQLEPCTHVGDQAPGTIKGGKAQNTQLQRNITYRKTTKGFDLVYSEEERAGWGLRTRSSCT